MDAGWFSLFVFLLLIHTVSTNNFSVKAFPGRTVLLPCSGPPSAVNVFWRYRVSLTVCDIIGGEVDFRDQELAYRDRVKTFPAEFKNGNFSIELSNVKPSDAGTYTCQILDGTSNTVELKVQRSRMISDDTTSAPGNSVAARRVHVLLVFLLTFLICFEV